jgi:hypothetical protein
MRQSMLVNTCLHCVDWYTNILLICHKHDKYVLLHMHLDIWWLLGLKIQWENQENFYVLILPHIKCTMLGAWYYSNSIVNYFLFLKNKSQDIVISIWLKIKKLSLPVDLDKALYIAFWIKTILSKNIDVFWLLYKSLFRIRILFILSMYRINKHVCKTH